MRIAVAGGTGVAGREIVAQLEAAGHEPVILARAAGVDIVKPSGLDAALVGVSVVIDASNCATQSKRKALAFFTAETQNLLAAEERAGVRHHVVLSIVGIDRVELGYYAGKRRQEELALAGPIPCSVMRATQFHDFAGQMLGRVPGPVALMPKMRVAPIAVTEVAAAIVVLAAQAPVGMAPQIAGPQEELLADLARRLLKQQGSRRKVLAVRLPGAAGRAVATGALLPTENGPRGHQTFAQWLRKPVLV